ncbi:MAG: TadE/TadG family type IV pilus assembly protein [Aeromicrobium sp.]|uniref:TadE/TadG family type IV pilus assembly protein n=1 Tax=Aeromicrobium sp. TaxID=1871063 RepID=UPI003C32A242
MNASRERGAVAVEFALVLPLLMAFLLGIIEGGTRYAQQTEVNHWAFIAARDLSIDPSTSATTVVDALKGSDTTTYAVTSAPTTKCAAAGATQVSVTVAATKSSPTGLFPDYQLTGRGVARCEN